MMRDDAGRPICGEFYRFDHEERTGPRGGRQALRRAVDPRWIVRLARTAAERLITGPPRADIAAGGAM
jgi:hypothetical protein